MDTMNGDLKLATAIKRRISEVLADSERQIALEGADGAIARATIFSFGGYFDRAVASLESALSSDQESDEALARLVSLQLLTGLVSEALEGAVSLTSRSPDFSFIESTSDEKISGFTLLGDALVRSGRPEDAQKAYELARERVPADSTSAARLAILYADQGRGPEAVDLLPVFETNPRHTQLAQLFRVGRISPNLLPTFDAVRLIERSVAGRPLTVRDGHIRIAPLITGESTWCEPESPVT